MIGRIVGVGVGVAKKIGGNVWKMIGGAVGAGVGAATTPER